jgi:hypothetical protein
MLRKVNYMRAYCILVINAKAETVNVSQEAYSSIEKARNFVLSRCDIQEVDCFNPDENSNIFIGKDTKYIVKEIRVI